MAHLRDLFDVNFCAILGRILCTSPRQCGTREMLTLESV
jgi:hypothetical protein